DGLLLYPHFRADLTTGWFDKFLPWRRHRAPALERMILISPSRAFVASLPRGKIPDRGDFRHLPPVERIRYWRACVERSRELAEDFEYQLSSSDPLQGTRRLDGAGK
ncbi:MAG: patatin-like phospholipase family protein, partial [Pseudomonadota bacterium]